MSSSDSEDDCYGNVALKLQKMKNQYKDDRIESTNLLNESTEIDDIVNSSKCGTNNKQQPAVKETTIANTDTTTCIDMDTAELTLEEVPLNKRQTRSNKRRTRSSARISRQENLSVQNSAPAAVTSIENVASVQTTPRGSRGRRQANRGNAYNSTRDFFMYQRSCARRGRRGRRSRGRPMYPIYGVGDTSESESQVISIGNTYEYPDVSESQQLFSTTKDDDQIVIIDENETIDVNEILDENEELSVKVYWQSSEFFKFVLRRYQKLTQIFDFFAKKEDVSFDKLLFIYREKILQPDDTPDSICYSIVKFIDGGIVNDSVTQLVKNNSQDIVTNGITLKFQCQNMKKPLKLKVGLDERLSVAMLKCAEHLELSLDKLKFIFDGDNLAGKHTPRELEFEGDECIDVKILS